MSEELRALCIKRNQLEMQLERSESKGGETITLTREECYDLFAVMLEAEVELDNWFEYGL